MIEWISQPWPWYVAGPLIGLTVPLLLILGNKSFGISANLRHICAACIPSNIPFFKYNWKRESWNLFFAAGILLGGLIAVQFLSSSEPLQLSENTQSDLAALGVTFEGGLMPAEIFSWDQIFTLRGLIFFVMGGFLVGFGTRYAGGCTSGHAIMGISNLQWPSLLSTCCFMAGGFLMTHLLLPVILKLTGF
ncbi:MAG TPA: YeeE/YedE thiosulfate transporter family protein [Saprospiraceae bacterium]|mgnify:FL=1|nr:YeeE/YedE thiosulfate transporter family protein [Saprospiraceae bacterium]